MEEKQKKTSIWTIVVGLFLIIRGGMRIASSNDSIGGAIGGVMLLLGIACVVAFAKGSMSD